MSEEWLREFDKGTRLEPDQVIPATGETAADFWGWACSDLASNTMRGVFAEYLVAHALEDRRRMRIEWDLADVMFQEHLVEVKSSAWYQTWPQKRASRLTFDVAKKHWWDASASAWSEEKSRVAKAYVFAHFRGRAVASAVTDADEWVFYVVAKARLDQELGDQKRVGIQKVRALSEELALHELKDAVAAAVSS